VPTTTGRKPVWRDYTHSRSTEKPDEAGQAKWLLSGSLASFRIASSPSEYWPEEINSEGLHEIQAGSRVENAARIDTPLNSNDQADNEIYQTATESDSKGQDKQRPHNPFRYERILEPVSNLERQNCKKCDSQGDDHGAVGAPRPQRLNVPLDPFLCPQLPSPTEEPAEEVLHWTCSTSPA
jgi:hypothetical protein